MMMMMMMMSAMMYKYPQGSWLMALNSGWQGGVHVQTCGHYLHLDCHRSYISSLKVSDTDYACRVFKSI